MKKYFVTLCAVSIILFSFALTACGSTYAKVVGICAAVGTNKNYMFGNDSPFLDRATVTDNDYILEAEQSYLLGIAYIQRGGSRLNVVNIENITLKYDTEVLAITPPEEKEGAEVYYNLTCKKAVVNTVVIVEVDGEYSDTVIITAK